MQERLLSRALGFLVLAVSAAMFGFAGLAEVAVLISRLIFFLFLLLFAVGAFFGHRMKI